MALTEKSALAKDQRTGKAEMQHRHFTTIAAIIKGYRNETMRRAMARLFADELAHTNLRFDRYRFLAACGAEDME